MIPGLETTMPGAWAAIKDISPSLSPINQNKTLFVAKLTDQRPLEPEAVTGLENTHDVFEHYKPEASATLYEANGMPAYETFQFRRLGDFTKDGLIAQSPVLRQQQAHKNDLQRIDRHLRSNKLLQAALQNPQAKAIILDMLQGMIDEIEQAQ